MGNDRKFSTKVLFGFPDIHFTAENENGVKAIDRHDPKALSVAFQLLEDIQPDVCGQIGDMLHLAYLSGFQVKKDQDGRVPSENGETMEACLDRDNILANRFWDKTQGLCPKHTEFFQEEGNHEEILRNCRNMRRYSGVKNLQDWYPERAWRLKERGIQWIPYQRYGEGAKNWYQFGKVKIIHGQYANMNHIKKHHESWGCNLIYGHMHTIQETTFISADSQMMVATAGCLSTPYASYHRGRNNAWQQAVFVVYLQPNGLFHYYPIRIVNGTAVWNGKTYFAKPLKGFE